MPHCAILNCKNSSKLVGREKGDVSFHRFPKNPFVKEKWIQATGNKDWFPTKHSTICSEHFTESSFIVASRKCRRLSETACPTINLLTNINVKKENISENYIFDDVPTTSIPKKIKIIDQRQTIPPTPKRKPPPVSESDDDQVDDDEAIYERDISHNRIKVEAAATVPEGRSRRHERCRCDVCRGHIDGFRYACVECANFDLCAACEARGEHEHHYVLRVPADKLNSDVQAVIKKIREELKNVDTEEGSIEENSIKIEIKQEDLKQEDPLEQTLQDASSQDIQCEENDSVTVKFLGPSEEGRQPVMELPLSYQSKHQPELLSHQPQVPSEQTTMPQILSNEPVVLSHQRQVLFHQPVSPHQTSVLSQQPQVLSHKPAVLSHEPESSHQPTVVSHRPKAQSKVRSKMKSKARQFRSQQLTILSHQPAVPQVMSHQPAVPQVMSHQPAVPQVSFEQPQVLSLEFEVPHVTTQEKRRLMLEAQAVDSERVHARPRGKRSYAVYTHRPHPDEPDNARAKTLEN